MSDKITHEGYLSPEDAQETLTQLAEAFRTGHIRLSDSEQEIVLEPSRILEMRVTARTKKDRQELSLSFRWECNHLQFALPVDVPAQTSLDADDVTAADLYTEAREFDIDGRSKMSREELADAVARYRAADERTRQDLYDDARRLGVEGRSSMTKHELAQAVIEREDA